MITPCSVETEREWWNGLTGEDRYRNLHGHPAYDVEAVARRLTEDLCLDWEVPGLVLDLGCGVGRLTTALAARWSHKEFIGCDFAPMLIAEAARSSSHPNLRFSTNDGLHLPSTEPLWGAYSVTVFQHLPHDVVASYIRQVAERLVGDGQFTFTISDGDDDMFLNHQMSAQLAKSLVGAAGLELEYINRDPIGWTWIGAVKP